ncbi:MAG: ABC transporter permease [Acidobacteria bacterium]|nr:ABC transporter permease [Acidobacteriota bacterium]
METLLNDVRHGCRMLLRNPGFTVVVILALALGIGANTAVFSVLNAVLLQPLPYAQSDQLVALWMRFEGIGIPDNRNMTSPPEFMDLRRFSTAFADIAALQNANYNIRIGDTPERIIGANVSANFFRLLRTNAHVGRTFGEDEDQQGKNSVVVLGYGLWQRLFASDTGVIGRTINVSGRSVTIVGVAPASFAYPNQAEMWMPLAFTDVQLTPNSRGNHGLLVLARMKPEFSIDQTRAEMDGVTQQIIEAAPQYPYTKFNFRVLVNPLLNEFVGNIRPALLILMGAVALVLLIACANVANLLLVRGSAREREIGIRAALGAGRKRLIRQLLTESMLLSLAGAAAGLALARFGISAITKMGGQAFPRLAQAETDMATLVFTIGVAVVTGLMFGILPALQVSQSTTHESLKEGGRGSTSGGKHQRLRRSLVVAEVALSLALLCGAGLLIKSFMRLQDIDPGFRPDGVLTARILLPQARYSQPEQIRTFYTEFIRRVSEIPGVQSVGGINALPLSGTGGSGTTTVDTNAVAPGSTTPEADLRAITPGYFETTGTPLIRGRYFNDRDNETSMPVAIIDETMANTYWPNQDPLGKRLKRGGPQSTNPWLTVVGVVRHVRYQSLERPSRVQLYWPQAQLPAAAVSVAIRTSMEPASLSKAVQGAAIALDSEQPIYAIRTMGELVADSVLRRRLVMTLLAIFAGLALVLAALGIYGVVSFWITQRSHEIGIRMALGATRGQVLKLVLGQSLSIVVSGIVVGLLGSLGLTRVLETLLFNVSTTDPATFFYVCVALLGVGLIACLVPAHRATSVDPVQALRRE